MSSVEYFLPNSVSETFLVDKAWSVEVVGPPCPTASTVYLVKTAPKNANLRRHVRKYFDFMSKSGVEAEMFFILGRNLSSESPPWDAKINDERVEFNDFIYGDFDDLYNNLPIKNWLHI